MNSLRNCVCKYRNPVEFVCTYKECKERRIICKSCAWDHKQHDSQVLQINEFETMITNDCLVQRIQNVQNAEGITHALDSLIEIAQTDIIKILKKRCDELKDKIKKHHNPFNRTLEHIGNISKKTYNSGTIDYLVKELDIHDLNGQLQKMEATQYQKFNLICKEIINLADALDRVRKACQEESSFELRGIKRTIEQNLDYQPIKECARIMTQQFQDYDDDYLPKQQQQQQQYQSVGNKKEYTIPSQLSQSHLEILKNTKYISQKAQPYTQEQRMKTDHQKTMTDYSFLDRSNPLKQSMVDLTKSRLEQYEQKSNRDYPFYQRPPSQSLYQSILKK